ncbi:MAG: hypothetical protein IJM74_09755 [Bacteroidales bacterium]|nr:hypothetical protein [Bacteroidales bacterium]
MHKRERLVMPNQHIVCKWVEMRCRVDDFPLALHGIGGSHPLRIRSVSAPYPLRIRSVSSPYPSGELTARKRS